MTRSSRGEALQPDEADIEWVCDALKLPKDAFGGRDGRDPRLEILKSMDTLDVEACPGSGKTTLLVAKLAILARKWADSHSGICVLSHTNVARREIERHLGKASEGKRLLAYPHFVGTIHGFVNEFLAIPWLRSLGHPIKVIDDAFCEQHRRRLLGLGKFKALAIYVTSAESRGKINVVSNWRLASPGCEVVRLNGSAEFLDPEKKSAKQLRALGAECLRDGYHRHNEMFMWARDLLDKFPDIGLALRARFPLLFLDEVQDNNEEQSALLFRIFMESDRPVLRQRFGDANQAIFKNTYETEGAITDCFPISHIRRDIPDSHRFGEEIGRFADPLAIEPQGLIGHGPSSRAIASDTAGKHTIFIFSNESVDQVISSYADYLQEVFSEQELRDGIFTAVGAVHRPRGENNSPRCVGRYWSDYKHQLTGMEPKPESFLQYLSLGRLLSQSSGETFHALEKLAAGLLYLARLSNPVANFGSRKRLHRYILELLSDNADKRAVYLELVRCLAVDQEKVLRDEWETRWSHDIAALARTIGGVSVDSQEVTAFLAWGEGADTVQGGTMVAKGANLFRHPAENPKVEIRVGSIHSVKGETHTATLVLETFYKRHHLSTLKPWILGQRVGKGREGPTNISRLKQHYVAMTRPTHLLCLAMKEEVFSLEELDMLRARGWRLARLTQGAPEWS